MPVTLPDLSRSKCYYLQICGEVGIGAQDVPQVLASKSSYPAARYEASGAVVYARIGWAPPKENKPDYHLHFDFVKEEWFDRKNTKPDIAIAPEEIKQVVATLEGMPYSAYVTGCFRIAESLPKVIQSITKGASSKSDGIEVELTEGTLSFRGGPIRKIRWEKDKDHAGFILRLTVSISTNIDHNLLISALGFVESTFSALYTGGQNDG